MYNEKSPSNPWGLPNTPQGIDHSKAGMAMVSEPIDRSGQLSGAAAGGCAPPYKHEQTVEDTLKGQILELEARLIRLRAAQVDAFLLNVLNAPAHRFRHIANQL